MKYKKPRRKTIECHYPSGKVRKLTYNPDDPDDQPILIELNCDHINKNWDSLHEVEKEILQELITSSDLIGEPPNLREP